MVNNPNGINQTPDLIRPPKIKNMTINRGTMGRFHTIITQHISSHALPKENISANFIISYIQTKSLSYLQRYSKTTKKKLLKHISQYIYLGIGKKFSKSQSFSDLIFQALFNKYNIKYIAERKFKEIIVGCLLNYAENTRIKLFLCCLGLGSYLKLKNISVEGCEMCLKCYEFMMTSKIGIILDSSDPLNVKYYPVSRAIECAKCKFEHILSRGKLHSLYSKIDALSESDQNRINKTGVIDLDNVIEIFTLTFEEYQEGIANGVIMCGKIITEYNYLTKGEVIVLLKHLSPYKQSLIKKIPFDEKNEIELNDFKNFCISKGILHIDVVENFFSKFNQNSKEIFEIFTEYEEKIDQISEVDTEDTLSIEEWKGKFEDLKFKLRGINNHNSLQLWHLLKLEIDYLKNT